jgi:predicted PurR-regulated permease PerM
VLVFGVRLPLHQLSVAIRETASQIFHPDRVFRVITSVMTNFVWVLIVLVVTYYLLLDWEHLREWFIGLFPEVYKTDVRRMHDEIIVVLRRYFRGQLLVMLLVGILSGLSGALVGLPKATILGLLTGMLDLIPSFGPIIATMLAAIVAWHKGSAFLPISNSWFTVIVIVIFMCIQAIENVWIQPRIMGRILKKHPGLIFVAVAGALTMGSACSYHRPHPGIFVCDRSVYPSQAAWS